VEGRNARGRAAFQAQQNTPALGEYPEALLQNFDNKWISEVPSAAESFHYVRSHKYVEFLLTRADGGDDGALEDLAQYLVFCMAGCRRSKRKASPSTEYDLVCSIEGIPYGQKIETAARTGGYPQPA
jgi:hypothetical protein